MGTFVTAQRTSGHPCDANMKSIQNKIPFDGLAIVVEDVLFFDGISLPSTSMI